MLHSWMFRKLYPDTEFEFILVLWPKTAVACCLVRLKNDIKSLSNSYKDPVRDIRHEAT